MDVLSIEADDRPATRLSRIWLLMAWLGLLVLGTWIRRSAFSNSGFVSHDVGGILYNAMVLLDGGLPYVDTREMKAPGNFYLATLLAGPEGRDIASFQAWAAIWSMMTAAICGWCAHRAFGPVAGVTALALYALHAPELDSIDANYVTWAVGFQALCLAALVETRWGPRGTDLAKLRPYGWCLLWLAVGWSVGWAGLCKRQAGLVLFSCIIAAGTCPRGLRRRALAWLAIGLLAALAPIVGHFAVRGHLTAFVEGYIFNRWGSTYLGNEHIGQWNPWIEGSAAHAYFLGGVWVWACANLSLRRFRHGDLRAHLWLWWVCTLVAACLGARFYKGYFVPCLLPLCLLAAGGGGLWARLWSARRPRLRILWRFGIVGLLTIGLLRQSTILDRRMSLRTRRTDAGARAIAAHLQPQLVAGDPIWLWGWHLWGVYAFTGATSPSRVYKSFSVITQPPENTWRRPGTRLRFVPGPASRELISQLKANPPRHIVLGSSAPHREFVELRQFLRARYRRDRRLQLGRVEFWVRRPAKAQR